MLRPALDISAGLTMAAAGGAGVLGHLTGHSVAGPMAGWSVYGLLDTVLQWTLPAIGLPTAPMERLLAPLDAVPASALLIGAGALLAWRALRRDVAVADAPPGAPEALAEIRARLRDDPRRLLVVVSQRRSALAPYLARCLGKHPQVRVIVDRRVGERRFAPGTPPRDRREGDRRRPARTALDAHRRPWVLVGD